MSKLEELIQQLCPDGVEFKELGEVVDIQRGRRLTKDMLSSEEQYPVFHGGIEPLGCYGQSNRKANTVMVINVGASAGKVGYSFVDFWSSDGCYCIENSELLVNRFVYYALLCSEDILRSKVRVAGIPTLDALVVKKIQIPIPSLPIQQEIVTILDKFKLLEAELEAELEVRKKQYEYYRNELLNFDGKEVEWKMLGNVTEIYDGTHQTPKYTEDGVKFVSVENIKALYYSKKCISKIDYERLYKAKPKLDDVFMTRIGSIGVCALVDKEEDLAYYVTLTLIRPNQKYIKSKYLKYIIESSIGQKELLKRTLVNATPIKINLGEIGKINIPVPPIAEQERFIRILDKFDALVNDISVGLPAEIEARKKQYEYYRGKLLDFKALTNLTDKGVEIAPL